MQETQNWFYRLFLKEIMELLPGALTSSQWAVKAQAARALGTVAKKLGANIQHEIQVSTAQQYIVQYTLVL